MGLDRSDRVTVHDLAKAAGVSLATVDRVLNGRAGVRKATIEKVEAAIAAIGYRRDFTASMLARARDIKLAFILPDGTNQFMAKLADAVAHASGHARTERGQFALSRVKAMDARALAEALDALAPDACDCAAIVAIDKPEVHAAVARATKRGVRVITLVSDLPGSARQGFVGIDNIAAGRTAASLMGRFLPEGSEVGLVAGAMGLIDHAERVQGFRQVVDAEFPSLSLTGPVEGQDAFTLTYEKTLAFLDTHPGLKGIYNVGAGNAGLVMALKEAGRDDIRVIAHELTGPTRAALEAGVIDCVIDQDPDAEIRAVWAQAKRLVLGPDAAPAPGEIEIKVFLRDNMR